MIRVYFIYTRVGYFEFSKRADRVAGSSIYGCEKGSTAKKWPNKTPSRSPSLPGGTGVGLGACMFFPVFLSVRRCCCGVEAEGWPAFRAGRSKIICERDETTTRFTITIIITPWQGTEDSILKGKQIHSSTSTSTSELGFSRQMILKFCNEMPQSPAPGSVPVESYYVTWYRTTLMLLIDHILPPGVKEAINQSSINQS